MTDERTRELETRQAVIINRLDVVERRQSEDRYEFRQLAKEMRKERQADTERIMDAITANRLSWGQMSTGTKVIAWVLGILISAGSAIAALGTLARKLFSGD